MTKNIQVLALSAAIDEAAAVAGRILLLRYGRQEYTTLGGGKGFYLFDRADGERLVAEFNRRGVEVAADYEHQALLSKLNGQAAPASGWVTALRLVAEGLEADVKWTPRALAMIQAKEYRYISPAFTQLPDGRVDQWINFALTNLPATDGSQALVAASQLFTLPEHAGENQPKEYPMKSVLTLLGLAADAPESDATAKLNAILAAHTAAEGFRARAVTQLGLAADASLGALEGAIVGLKKQAEQVTALSAELATIKTAKEQAERDQLIADALADGRLSNAQQDWAKTVALDILTGYLATTPKGSVVPVPPAGDSKDRQDAVALSSVDATVAKACGLDSAQVQEAWKKHQQATA